MGLVGWAVLKRIGVTLTGRGRGGQRHVGRWLLLAPAVLALMAQACSTNFEPVDSESVSQRSVESDAPDTEMPASPPTATARQSEPVSAPATPVYAPPRLDTSIASVPLSDIVFDTFRGGFILLSEASDSQIENLRDRIQPIYSPKYDGPEGGDWLDSDDMVIGYESAGGAFAYPIKMLNLHELVNDVIDGEPVLITLAPLTQVRILAGQPYFRS